MKKFDKRVWIFILSASFLIPGYFLLQAKVLNTNLPDYFMIFGIPFSFVVTLVITYVNMVLIGRYFDKVLPWVNNSKKITLRLILEISITTISAGILISFIAYLMNIFFPQDDGRPMAEVYFHNITVAVIINMVALSIIEGNSIYIMLKESLFETEKLQRENAEVQFAVLKNQVNPHFLFNSLNVLSSLVSQSPATALEFVQEFAKIYRYIFDVGNQTVVTVKDELDFIQSYISLQKKRHGECLQMTVKIESGLLDGYIPVLALQILVENAIKHNEISGMKPLLIDIYNVKDQLYVKNNYQPRKDLTDSRGIGLKNLKERYRYLSEQEPEFFISNGDYVARLPVLPNE